MSKFMAELTALSCKQFARHVASDDKSGGLLWRLQFWTHWVICEFCRRYWEELKTIGQLHKKSSKLTQEQMKNLPAVKQRLRQRLKDL